MESIDAENARGDLGSKRRLDRPIPPRLQIQIPHPIPQITYSKPADETNQEQAQSQLDLSAGSANSNNDNSLTPPRSPYRSLSSPTSPLPLTRDILSKKDKLEKSLERAELHNRRQGERLGNGLDIKEWQRTAHYHQHNRNSSVGSAVEPVSAGGSLTIPSPNDPSHFFLRSPTSPQILNFGYENIYRYPEPSARHSSQSGSSANVNRWSSFMSSKSANSGSSIAEDNLSAEAFDPATHYYTNRDEYLRQMSAERHFHARLDLQRSQRSRFKHQKSTESSTYIWNLLSNVASRVVLSKSCETPESQLLSNGNPSAAAAIDWMLLTGDDAYLASQHLEKQETLKHLKSKDSHSYLSTNARHSQSTDRRFSISRQSDSALEKDKLDDHHANYSTSLASSPRIPDSPRPASSIKHPESLKVSSIQNYPNYNDGAYKKGADNGSIATEIEHVIEVTENYDSPSPLQGYSLFVFSPKNPFRLALWRLMRSKTMEFFIFLLISAQWILLASNPIYTNEDKTTFGASNVHYAILAIQCIYSLEIIAKVIVYGLIIKTPSKKSTTQLDEEPHWTIPLGTSLLASVLGKCLYYLTFGFLIPQSNNGHLSTTNIPAQPSSLPPSPLAGPLSETIPPAYANPSMPELNSTYYEVKHRSFLSNFGNWLDLISVICYWVDLVLMKVGYTKISMFKGFGAARPLRLVGIIPGTAAIMRSLEASLELLFNVFGFVFFFMLVFALIGVMTYRGSFSRSCYEAGSDGSYTLAEPFRMCSGYYNGTDLVGIYIQELDVYDYPRADGYICPNGLVCLQLAGSNPQYGFLNMDNLYFSLLNLFTVMSLEGWTDMMYDAQDGESSSSAAFFCLAVYILSFIMIPLFIAVITTSFAQVRSESRLSAFTAKKQTHPILLPADNVDESLWTYGDADLSQLRNSAIIRRFLSSVVNNWKFAYFGGALVFCNLVIMACRSIYASEDVLEAIDTAEIIFTFIFALEIFVRLLGARSWIQFWLSGRNRFDLFLVVSTCIIQLPMIQGSDAYKYLTLFQCMRSYRLLLCFPRVRRLLSSALGSGEGVINVGLFLLWSTALFAPIAMQLFGGDFGFMAYDETELRFDTFLQSFLALFDIFTSENWTDILYNSMESQYHASAIYAAIFLVALYCFSHYIILNLFVAVILENFELDEDKIKIAQIKSYFRRHRPPESELRKGLLDRILVPLQQNRLKRQLRLENLPRDFNLEVQKSMFQDILFPIQQTQPDAKKPGYFSQLWIVRKCHEYFFEPPKNMNIYKPATLLEETTDDYDVVVADENKKAKQDHIPALPSLLFFSPNNRFRRWCKQLVGSSSGNDAERKSLFNWFIMACVLASIFIVVLDEPAARKLQQYIIDPETYDIIDYTLTAIFVLEIILRIIADGLIMIPDSYLRDPWNQLDFCVVILNVATVFGGSSQIPRALRTVRSFRILRLMRYFPGVRHIFADLLHGFPLMVDALLLTFLVLIPFCIYAVNIFGGKFYLCNDGSVGGLSECTAEFLTQVGDDPSSPYILIPRVWANPYGYDFDTFPDALSHLFDLTSTEGWILTLFSAMSMPSEADVQPQFDWNASTVYNCLYFIVFMVVAHGTVQLFVGVILENFKQRNGISTLTVPQRQYADLLRQLAQIKPARKQIRPLNPIRAFCYRLVVNKRGLFHKIMIGLVMLNIAIIATEYEGEPTGLSQLQDYAYIVFIFFYLAEVLIKVLGLGWNKWVQNKWNRYDCVIVICTATLCVLRFALESLWTQRLEQYLLVLVSIRLGQGFSSLQTLFHAVQASLPSILNVSAIFMMVMCLFAILFMEFFGLTKFGPYGNDHANFRSYGNSLLTLVRMTTGENWDFLMHDFTVTAPNCVSSDSSDYLDSDCGNPVWAYLMFVVFYIICTHIFLNLFTVVIISNFQYAYEHTARFTLITKSDLRKFKQAWAEVDPKGTGYISKDQIAALLRNLHGRLSLNIYDEPFSLQNLLALAKTELDEASGEKAGSNYTHADLIGFRYRFDKVNERLQHLNGRATELKRKQYNMIYTEILWAETYKGISFDNALSIMAFRFIDPEQYLTLEPLLNRLEKMEKLQQDYAVQKVKGYFLTMAERKRYLRKLWHKHNEEEIARLGVLSANENHFIPGFSQFSPEKSPQKPSIPRIVINNDGESEDIDEFNLSQTLTPGSQYSPRLHETSPITPNFQWTSTSPSSTQFENNSMISPARNENAQSRPPLSPTSFTDSHHDSISAYDSEADMLVERFDSCMWTDLLNQQDPETR